MHQLECTWRTQYQDLCHTNFEISKYCPSTLTVFLNRYNIRRGTTPNNRTNGSIERILSSNRRVKSKPPRQLPTLGPNVLSTSLHVAVDMVFTAAIFSSFNSLGQVRVARSSVGRTRCFSAALGGCKFYMEFLAAHMWSRNVGTESLG